MIATIVGYVASVLLAISLMVNSDLRFRWLNCLGCLAFIVYGLMINALPVIMTNALLLLINLVYLVKLYNAKERFDLMEFEAGSTLIKKFLDFYQQDIAIYFPEFKAVSENDEIRFVVTRDLVIANIFAASLHDNGTAEVNINYTVAKYRDYKIGKFIFEKEKQYLLSRAIKRLVYVQSVNRKHEKFLSKMGFRKVSEAKKLCFVKELAS